MFRGLGTTAGGLTTIDSNTHRRCPERAGGATTDGRNEATLCQPLKEQQANVPPRRNHASIAAQSGGPATTLYRDFAAKWSKTLRFACDSKGKGQLAGAGSAERWLDGPSGEPRGAARDDAEAGGKVPDTHRARRPAKRGDFRIVHAELV